MQRKIFAVLASLVALWAFAAYVTVGEGMSLVWLATLEQQVAKPTESLIAAIQAERRVSVEYAAAPKGDRSTLEAARRTTDAAVTLQRTRLQTTLGRWSTSHASDYRLAALLSYLEGMPNVRADLDAAESDWTAVNEYYTGVIQLGFDVYDTYTAWDDNEVIYQTNTVVMLTHSQEMVSQEDALIAGVIKAGVYTAENRKRFVEMLGAQRYLSRQVAERLPQPDQDDHRHLMNGRQMTDLLALENRLAQAPIGKPLALDAAQWRAITQAAVEAFRMLVIKLADRIVKRVQPAAIWIVVRLLLAAGLGLVAVVASIRFTIRSLRQLQRQLAELRVAALDLANARLPRVVARLQRGEHVDVQQEAPPLAFGDDDVGQVGRAFNAVQQTAIEATVHQAELRQGVRDIFANLAHRIQALVHRQLKLIDTMERQADSDEELAGLYQIDHLATRMRRNAENLIVLSGIPAGRSWRGPVSMVDVLRGAIAEVEDYPRIKLRATDPGALAGRAVGDAIHLLAELLENATSFSPPQTEVDVTGHAVHNGYFIEIVDRGLGMTAGDIEQANQHIANPPEFQLSSTARLGFFVVGKLASRYDMRVNLRSSPYQGVTATVFFPSALLDEVVEAPPMPMRVHRERGTAPAVAPAEPQFTPAGLPWRQKKQAVAASAEPVTAQIEAPEKPNGRTPEEVSRMMAAYAEAAQRGSRAAENTRPLNERAGS